jgi:hypothetical protein
MDTKFSAGGDGSHPGKHGIAAQTGCSKTAFSAAPHTCLTVILPLFLFSLLIQTSEGVLPVVILKLCKPAAHACSDEM